MANPCDVIRGAVVFRGAIVIPAGHRYAALFERVGGLAFSDYRGRSKYWTQHYARLRRLLVREGFI